MSEIKNVVVVGAGLMGSGIAQVSLQAGYEVTLVDIKTEYIDKGLKSIHKALSRLEQKGRLGEGKSADGMIQNTKVNTDLAQAVKNADIVVEAAIENMKVKQEIFKTCCENAPSHCILASNTSSMSITEIASATSCKGRVVGIHFFNPVPLMRLVEIIKGDETSDATMDTAVAWAQGLPCRGKRYVPKVLKDRPGFIANRVAAPGFIYLSWCFDQAKAKGLSWEALNADTIRETSPMGMLELFDYVGHDTYVHINRYYAEMLSPDFMPGGVYLTMVESGATGRKSGKGFFDWSEGRPKLDATNKANLVSIDIVDAIEANEGCRLLEEGVIEHWEIIDDTMMAGYGRPGVMANAVLNHEKWVKILDDLFEKIGKEYLRPCDLFRSGKYIPMK